MLADDSLHMRPFLRDLAPYGIITSCGQGGVLAEHWQQRPCLSAFILNRELYDSTWHHSLPEHPFRHKYHYGHKIMVDDVKFRQMVRVLTQQGFWVHTEEGVFASDTELLKQELSNIESLEIPVTKSDSKGNTFFVRCRNSQRTALHYMFEKTPELIPVAVTMFRAFTVLHPRWGEKDCSEALLTAVKTVYEPLLIY